MTDVCKIRMLIYKGLTMTQRGDFIIDFSCNRNDRFENMLE